jgi:hypothetical protein
MYYMVVDPDKPRLARKICRKGVWDTTRVLGKGWEVEGRVVIQSQMDSLISLSTGSDLIELNAPLWEAFVERLDAKNMRISKTKSLSMIEGCLDPESTLPILHVYIGKTRVGIHPRDYVIAEPGLPRGVCMIAINRANSNVTRIGLKFLQSIATVFDSATHKGTVSLCTLK